MDWTRKWKEWADAASPSNLMAYLFAKDNVLQSIRLGFAGAWENAFPELTEPLVMIQKYCPQLLYSFVPPSERIAEEEDDNDEADIIEDANHLAVNVDIKGYRLPSRIGRITCAEVYTF
jgi:hypothetical protein